MPDITSSDADYRLSVNSMLDQSSRIVIVVGDQQGRVYWLWALRSPTRVCRTSAISYSLTLWHRHLGHPDASVLSFLPICGTNISSHDNHVMFVSKQRKQDNLFMLSQIK